MLRRSVIGMALALACAACAESRPERGARPKSADAGVEYRDPLDPSANDGTWPPPKPRALDAEEMAWAAAADFSIGFERTGCWGTCPIFELEVRGSGDMRFVGAHYVKPGTYDLQLPRADVAKLYADLILRGILRLDDSYTAADDTCLGYSEDSPSSILTLRAGDREKRIVRSHGCQIDPKEAATLDAIERDIFVVAELSRFITQRLEPGCGYRFPNPKATLTARYVLRDLHDSPLGILEIEPDSSERMPWNVTTCDGSRLAWGTTLERWDCGYLLVPAPDTRLAWPGTDEPQAAVVIAAKQWGALADDVTLTLITLENETRQRGAQGTSCD